MEKDWSLVYKAANNYQAVILKGMLKENDIDSIIINQKDSGFMSFGNTLLYVHNDHFEKARLLIEKVESKKENEEE